MSAYERGEWEKVNMAAAEAGIEKDMISSAYLQAISWSEETRK